MPEPQNLKTAIVNPQLQQAITAFKAENSRQNLTAVINAMLRAVLIAPVMLPPGVTLPKPDAQRRVVFSQKTPLTFPMLTAPDGSQFFMGFTDLNALKAMQGDVKPQATVLLRFDDLAALIQRNEKAAGFFIDPFAGNGLRITRQMVETIVKQRAALQKQTAVIQPGDKITMVEPSVLPDEFLDPLCAILAETDAVNAAYLQIMIRNDTERNYLLVLDGDAAKPLMDRLAGSVRPYLTAKKMNLIITTANSPLGKQGIQGSEPFYRVEEGRIYDEDEE